MASNFQGLTNTKRHTTANGINAGGLNAGANCPGVLSMVLMKICLGFFVRSLCVTGSFDDSVYPICKCWNGNDPLLLGRGEDGMLVTTQWGVEALMFLEKLKSPKHTVNGKKIENTGDATG